MTSMMFYPFCLSMLMFMIFIFFFNATATTEIYTLSLHDALPIFVPSSDTSPVSTGSGVRGWITCLPDGPGGVGIRSEEHTLNSSHGYISYAVFCLKKKKKP